MGLLIHAAERGMGVLAQRIYFDRLIERLSGQIVLARCRVSPTNRAIRKFVIGIEFVLLLQRCDRIIVLSQDHVSTAQVHPRGLVLGVGVHYALEELSGSFEIAALIRSFRCVVEFVAFQISSEYWSARGRTVNREV